MDHLNALVSRMLFHNPTALRSYMQGEFPLVEDIVRDIYIEEWRNEHHFPDHYLKNRRDFVIGLQSDESPSDMLLSEVILRILDDVAERYLHWNGNQLFVKEDVFGEWQALLPRISPLLIMCRMIQKRAGPCPENGAAQNNYVRQWLLPNVRISALPYPLNPIMDAFVRREGLVEIHCHLNGSTEFDYIWMDAISRPAAFSKELDSGYRGVGWSNTRVQEQYEQIERGLRPEDVWRRLHAVRNLRRKTCAHVYGGRQLRSESVLRDMAIELYAMQSGWNTHKHPAEEYLWKSNQYGSLTLEAGFIIEILSAIESNHNPLLTHTFYFCQLVSSLIIKLVVQQIEQSGFDQFQKITLNEARSVSEKTYARRISQLEVTQSGDLKYLEGRFAPKSTEPEIRKLHRKIEKGFQTVKANGSKLELGLVCHFIKKPEVTPVGYRYHQLRQSLEDEGRALVAAFGVNRPKSCKFLVGIDSASNELHTPPEVFAPLFRCLRRRGATNFTYHVGEDFVHLLSGLRAIYEAVRFLSLGPGNRLAHCTAIGVEPNLWFQRAGNRVVMRQGEYLDDLVFAYNRAMGLSEFSTYAPRVADEIEKLSKRTYGRPFTPQTLHDAWCLRSVDPMLAFNPSYRERVLDQRDKTEEETILDQLRMADSDSNMLFYDYHGQHGRSLSQVYRLWNEFIEVDIDILPAEILRRLQEMQLEELVAMNIAIECLPTSNVRISIYKDYSEHHIFRWLGLASSKGVKPIICIGSDDPGIFATSLRAEYYHLYREIVQTYKQTPNEALAILEQLGRNSDTFKFKEETVQQR